jgi:hypothetical protein
MIEEILLEHFNEITKRQLETKEALVDAAAKYLTPNEIAKTISNPDLKLIDAITYSGNWGKLVNKILAAKKETEFKKFCKDFILDFLKSSSKLDQLKSEFTSYKKEVNSRLENILIKIDEDDKD